MDRFRRDHEATASNSNAPVKPGTVVHDTISETSDWKIFRHETGAENGFFDKEAQQAGLSLEQYWFIFDVWDLLQFDGPAPRRACVDLVENPSTRRNAFLTFPDDNRISLANLLLEWPQNAILITAPANILYGPTGYTAVNGELIRVRESIPHFGVQLMSYENRHAGWHELCYHWTRLDQVGTWDKLHQARQVRVQEQRLAETDACLVLDAIHYYEFPVLSAGLHGRLYPVELTCKANLLAAVSDFQTFRGRFEAAEDRHNPPEALASDAARLLAAYLDTPEWLAAAGPWETVAPRAVPIIREIRKDSKWTLREFNKD